MNKKDLFLAMNDIDDRFITEAEGGMTKRKRYAAKNVTKAVVSIAAAAVLTVSAGAAAYTLLENRQSVEHYLGESAADLVESGELVQNLVSSNEHIKFTLDTILNDGKFAEFIITYDCLDDEGKKLMEEIVMPDLELYYADTDEIIAGAISSQGYSADSASDNEAFVAVCDISLVDVSRPLTLKLYSDELCLGEYVDGSSAEAKENELEGIEFSFNLEKNIESVAFESADGNQISLSPISLSGDVKIYDTSSVSFVNNDGKTINALAEDGLVRERGSEADFSYVVFNRAIDPTEYTNITINGVEYLKK